MLDWTTPTLAGLLLALLACGCPRSAASLAPPHEPTPSVAPMLEPGPRHASTFVARNDGCRGLPLDAYEGIMVLTIAADHQTALELTLRRTDLLGDMPFEIVPPPQPREPPTPTVCRWTGVGQPAPGRFVATLAREGASAEDSLCGEDSRLELRCRPEVLGVRDDHGDLHPTEVLLCTPDPQPTVFWVLGGQTFVLASTALHSQVVLGGFGLPQQVLSQRPAPAPAPAP